MILYDDLHYSTRAIDGYNKPFKFILSAREPGKTTAMWYKKIYSGWTKDNRPWIYLTRNAVDISEALIESISGTISKFIEMPITLEYTKSALKSGICDVRLNGKIFVRFIALSIPLRRIKLAVLPNLKGVFMDEYIIDPRTKESYVTNEAFKIKEAYTTWVRECSNLQFYFCANPYSLFNPLFVDWGVDVTKLKLGEFYVGDIYVIEFARIKPELRALLLKNNPLYQFDEDYKGYALDGNAVNDRNINIGARPENFQLEYVFKLQDKHVGIYQNNDVLGDIQFYCDFVEEFSKRRQVVCLELNDLVAGCTMFSTELRLKLKRFKRAMSTRAVLFSNATVYYLIKGVYDII